MIVLLSPAKSLDLESPTPSVRRTRIRFPEQSAELVDHLKTLSPSDLRELMGISADLAELNADRYSQWRLDAPRSHWRAAVFLFDGDVYSGLEARDMSPESLRFAQKHLRILSGLYGLLRPLDAILPYRLEMGTRLEFNGCKNLYEFWGDRLAEQLKEDLRKSGQGRGRSKPFILNLASQEYVKAVKRKNIDLPQMITPKFLDRSGGDYKMISFYAKKARGLMARYVIEDAITDVAQINAFDLEGYYFDPERSRPNVPVFLRDSA